jgi:hypothetical protein
VTRDRRNRFRPFEGRTVSLALIDGTRLDDCQLVSAGRQGTGTLWLYENGADRFVALEAVVDLWEACSRGSGHGIGRAALC